MKPRCSHALYRAMPENSRKQAEAAIAERAHQEATAGSQRIEAGTTLSAARASMGQDSVLRSESSGGIQQVSFFTDCDRSECVKWACVFVGGKLESY